MRSAIRSTSAWSSAALGGPIRRKTGGSVPAIAKPFSIFGYPIRGDRNYFYVVLAYLVVCYLLVTNLMRTRDGRALVAVRDHYLSAEIMGINLTKYRTLSFGLAAFFAGCP